MQKNSSLHLEKDKIVRATAGAGKTTQLIKDVYETYLTHKKESGNYPRILLTTFTVKAANELSERLFSKAIEMEDKEFLNYGLSSYLEIGTMHSVFSSILNQLDQSLSQNNYVSYSYKYNIAKGFFTQKIEELELYHLFSEPYDFDETLNFFLFLERSNFDYTLTNRSEALDGAKRLILGSHDVPEDFKNKITTITEFNEFEDLISGLDSKENKKLIALLKKEENNNSFIDEFYSYNEKIKDLYQAWSLEFKEFIRENALYTIEDIESLVLNLVKDKDVTPRWDYCFFDEYQDTSPEQKTLIETFCYNAVKYFVGDPFQSIYFFRGARKEIFDNEFARIKNQNLNVEYKTTSYRSAKNIIHFVNHISCKIFPDFDKLTPFKDEDGKVQVAFFEEGDIDTEIDFLIDKIKDLEPKDVMILSKQTKNLSKAYKKLKEKGLSALPLYGDGVSTHLNSYELIHLIRFLANQKDEDSLRVLVFSDLYGFSEKELASFINQSKVNKKGLWFEIKDDVRLAVIKSLVDSNVRYSEAVRIFLSESGFLNRVDEIKANDLKEFNCFKILQALEVEEKKPGFNIEAFCDDLIKGRYPFGKEGLEAFNSYKLMTIHGSKGLEAKHVFILGCNQGYKDLDRYPLFYDEGTGTSAAKVKDKNLNRTLPLYHQSLIEIEKSIKKEENRRLFYVAMTRAEESLFVIGSGAKEKKPSEPSWMSQILKSLDDDELSFVDYIDEFQKNDLESSIEEKSPCFNFFKNEAPLKWLTNTDENLQDYSLSDVYDLSLNIKRGIDFHAYMERGSQTVEDYDLALNYLVDQKEFPFEKIFKEGFKEWGYDWLNPDTMKVESGKIDLWADLDEEVWIVDYKTGSLSGVDKGFEQLKRYKNVLESFFQEKKIYKLVLTFPFKRNTILLDG